jgi:septum formation protein
VEILTSLGLSFTVGGVDIDETPRKGEDVREMVLRLAEAKAREAAKQHQGLVLGSDTAVALDGVIFGKPAGEQEALEMLGRLSGRIHHVLTGVALIAGDRVLLDLSVTSVKFREIQADEARQYWQSGEPEGKAGAYAIQGLGGVFVDSISGSYSGVVGLPVFETAMLLQQAGVMVIDAKLTEDASAE